MNWKDIELRVDTRFVPSLQSSSLKEELVRRLFGEKQAGVRAEFYLKEHWSILTGSAGPKSVPLHLEDGVLYVNCGSAAVAQEIHLRFLKIKAELLNRTGYELKGIRIDGGQKATTARAEKRDAKDPGRTDKEIEAEGSPFIDEIRKVLGLK